MTAQKRKLSGCVTCVIGDRECIREFVEDWGGGKNAFYADRRCYGIVGLVAGHSISARTLTH